MLDLALASLLVLSAPAAGAPPALQSPDAKSLLVPEAGPPDPSPTMEEYLSEAPPPGSPGEVALWKAGMSTSREIWLSRAASMQLRNRVQQGAYARKLDQAIAAAGHEDAERLQKVRTRLRDADLKNLEIFRRRWTIDPYRACGYPQLNYDSAMRMEPGANRQAEVRSAAVDLQSCVDRASVPVAAMKQANLELGAALEVARRALEAAAARPGEGHEAHERHEAGDGAEKGEKAERK